MTSKFAKLALTATIALAITLTLAQAAMAEKPPEKIAVGTFTDIRNKKTYKTVKIGEQTWMAENLNIDLLNSKCYENKPDNCQKYGRLYDWKTAMKACPSGWYLPSEADWGDLMQFVNPSCPFTSDCADAGAKLKAAGGWNGDGNGTDNYGFAALPGGIGLSGSNFRDAGNGGLWWSSSDDGKKAARLSMDIDGPDVHRSSSDKNLLFSIRCLQGEPSQAQRGSFADPRDKKNYKTVKIGEQIWMAENLNYAVDGAKCYNDGEYYFRDSWDKIPYSPAEIQANCDKYGRLYDWQTAMKVCPSGWHLPSIKEWDKLLHYVDGTSGTESPYQSETAGKYLKSKSGWEYENRKNSNRSDKYGFSALPGGKGSSGSRFQNVEELGYWWTSSEWNVNKYVYSRLMNDSSEGVGYSFHEKSNGDLHSIRCIKD